MKKNNPLEQSWIRHVQTIKISKKNSAGNVKLNCLQLEVSSTYLTNLTQGKSQCQPKEAVYKRKTQTSHTVCAEYYMYLFARIFILQYNIIFIISKFQLLFDQNARLVNVLDSDFTSDVTLYFVTCWPTTVKTFVITNFSKQDVLYLY